MYTTPAKQNRYATKHLDHIRNVLQLLWDNGIVVHYDTNRFGTSMVEFLGHEISAAGTSYHQMKAVKNFPTPITFKHLQEFVALSFTNTGALLTLTMVIKQSVSDKPSTLASSAGSSARLSRNTALPTANYSLSTSLSALSDSLWKTPTSPFKQIIGPRFTLSPRLVTSGLPDNITEFICSM
ncbi:uncharacterized protein LOC122245429 [Penaeus japonicus]|uniref:uncharacterized protein LOC122245429 n=1 Tax=Penaeus japonicus TaxID=27405 RepID=UPI001C717AAB|nr:uncharacterized protein LOC122245429 [Penaeus japonicus]